MTDELKNFEKAWPWVKRYPFKFLGAVLTVVIPVAGATYFIFQGVIWNLNAEISNKNSKIDYLSVRLEGAERDIEKLSKQNDELKVYRGQDELPLKKRALILARQIQDFIKPWKDSDDQATQMQNVEKYLRRFGTRALLMRGDLDQNGQQSDAFDEVMFNFSMTYKDVRVIADELGKLANNLKE